MSQKNYIDNILYCFAQMDIEGLRTLLKDEYSYNDCSKEIFLNALELVFNSLRVDNDELFIKSGRCNSCDCNNSGSLGYSFIGNRNKNYLNLIFNVIDHDIKDIFACGEFQTDEPIDDLGAKMDLMFDEDDKIDFYKSELYYQKVEMAKAAFDEIICQPPKFIDLSQLNKWLIDHSYTYELIDDNNIFSSRMKWSPFVSLYADLKSISDFIAKFSAEIKKANLQYDSIKNETDLIAFVLENEHLVKDLPLIWDYEHNQEENYYEYLQIDNPINFCGQELIDFFKFLWNYNTQHSLLLEKYGSLSPEEQSYIYNNHDYDHYDISSLQLQLQIRKSFKALGFELPLFINNNRKP
jgi:hypothetical protein